MVCLGVFFICSKTSYSMRVVRVALSNDKRVIGIRYPECLVELAEEVVREQKLLETLQAVRIFYTDMTFIDLWASG